MIIFSIFDNLNKPYFSSISWYMQFYLESAFRDQALCLKKFMKRGDEMGKLNIWYNQYESLEIT